MIQTTQNCCSFRIGSFSVLTGVCILASFLCQIYEFLNKDIWNSSLQDLVLCNIKNQVQSSIHLFIHPALYTFKSPGPSPLQYQEPGSVIYSFIHSSCLIFIHPALYTSFLSFLHTFILYYFYAFIYPLISSSCYACIHSFILHPTFHSFIYLFIFQSIIISLLFLFFRRIFILSFI